MGAQQVRPDALTGVRKDYIDQRRYTSAEFARLEMERLWTKTWHWACREEDIPQAGDYLVYDIGDQSVIMARVRTDEIKAFHNVCPHRGRRLLSGKGKITRFHCIFHAWQWDLDGNNTRILDHEQWQGCPDMRVEDMALSQVQVARWGGFVFINMDPGAEPFETFIQPTPEALDVLRMEDMRYAWFKSIKVKCNWKVAQEAFMESYHVWGTHPQFMPYIDEKNTSHAQGRHGNHVYTNELPPGASSRRLGKPPQSDDEIRPNFVKFIEIFGEQLALESGDGQTSARSIAAGKAAVEALPQGSSMGDAIGAAFMAMKAAADEDGAYFPLPTPEEQARMGDDWNVFPNLCVVRGFDGTLIFRAHPDQDDIHNPDACVVDMISLIHWGKGKAPKVEQEFLNDWRKQKERIPSLLVQDLLNMEDVQRGMHSIGLRGLRPNPVQEVQITHFHDVINSYLFA